MTRLCRATAVLSLLGCREPNPAYEGPRRGDADAVAGEADVARPSLDALAVQPDGTAVGSGADGSLDAAGRGPLTAAAALVAYWPLDEGAGTTASTVGPPVLVGSVQGALWTADHPAKLGASSGGLNFDGQDDGVLVNAPLLPNVTEGFSMALWMKVAHAGTGVRETIVTLWSADESHSLHLGRYRDGRLAVWTYGGVEVVPGPSPTTLVWQHVAYVFDGVSSTLWLDGTQVGLTTSKPSAFAPAAVMLGRYSGGEPYGGALDDVRVYDRALTAAELARLASGAL